MRTMTAEMLDQCHRDNLTHMDYIEVRNVCGLVMRDWGFTFDQEELNREANRICNALQEGNTLSLQESATCYLAVTVSTEQGELPEVWEIADLVGESLFHEPLDRDGNLAVLAVSPDETDDDWHTDDNPRRVQ